ncbi:MAG: DUF3305 domain-containing protein [Chromatiaceae bacterium]|jgi:hypothetical protein|nr:DUF3305 domain-containing protein [Chromatiaceae bacterium]
MTDTTSEPQVTEIGHLPVVVILERRIATSRWADYVWSAAGITVGRGTGGTDRLPHLIREDQNTAYFAVEGLEVALYVDECESYYYNLISDAPQAYVLAHAADDSAQPQPFRVSMSFDEAHAYLEGDDQVYAVAVPAELYRWTEAFVIANYFPEKKRKRKLRDWTADDSVDPAS